MPVITGIADLRELARRRVPRMFFDYLDAGSWTEGALRAHVGDLQAIKLRQRVGVPIGNRSLRTQMARQEVVMPVALAPTALTGMQHADGEMLAARTAKAFGVLFTLTTISICSMEDMSQAVDCHPFWVQLYVMKDRTFEVSLIDRAKAMGCTTLMATMDVQLVGQRHQSIRNVLSAPPRWSLRKIANIATRPRWAWGMLRTQRRSFGNIVGHTKGVHSIDGMAEWAASQYNAQLQWGDIAWIKRRWGGRLMVKGILGAEDARLAVASGADALVVSNHGGRQLDGAPSAIHTLTDIVDAVGRQIEAHMGSGIRSGQDVLKARALGAQGMYVGRAYLYGLGALVKTGVTRALEIIRKELDLTMAMCGHTNIEQVDRRVLVAGTW